MNLFNVAYQKLLISSAFSLAFEIGKGAIAGGALFGLGALCYYGLGLSNDVGVIETSR